MGKIANAIVVGGPIAVGKSTLMGSLLFEQVPELLPDDELQSLLLEKMYQGDKIAQQLFQIDMLLNRSDRYQNLANKKKMHFFDRTILEDIFFAKHYLKDYPNIWEYYQDLWNIEVEAMKQVGLPKLYILLVCSWATFKKRVFARNRIAEINNFKNNEHFFKDMIKNYQNYMEKVFKNFKISYVVINTDSISALQVQDIVKQELRKKGIKYE